MYDLAQKSCLDVFGAKVAAAVSQRGGFWLQEAIDTLVIQILRCGWFPVIASQPASSRSRGFAIRTTEFGILGVSGHLPWPRSQS